MILLIVGLLLGSIYMAQEKVYKPVEKVTKIYTGGTLQPPKFMPSYYEWLSTKGARIILSTATTGTLYTVPANHTLYVVTAWATVTHTLAGYARLTISPNIMLMCWCPANASESISSNFNIPLKVNGGESITYAEIGSGHAGFTGFVVNNNDIPVF